MRARGLAAIPVRPTGPYRCWRYSLPDGPEQTGVRWRERYPSQFSRKTRQGPLGDLGGWSRGPCCARVFPGKLAWVNARAIVRRFALADRAASSASSGTGLSRYRYRSQSAGAHSRRAMGAAVGLLRVIGACTVVRNQPGHAGPAPARAASWPTRRAKVGTFRCGRSSAIGLSLPSTVGRGRRPAGPYQPDGLVGRPGEFMRALARASQRLRRGCRWWRSR